MTDLTTQTPAEIDTVLAEIYGRFYTQRARSQKALETLESYEAAVERNEAAKAAGTSLKWAALSYITQSDVDKAAARLTVEEAKTAEILAETKPFTAEFARRGGWTRAYLVDNTNGHVHNSTGCSTCFPTTQFVWLPEYSGHDEAEVVADAGEQACTVCFPTAPCVGKSKIEAPAKRKSRIEREAAKAERDAKKAAKAIVTPEGADLKVFSHHYGERVVQIDRAGNTKIVPAHDTFETLSTAHAAKSWLTDSQETRWTTKRIIDIEAVAEALAHKFGTTPSEEISAAHKRAQKRR